MLTISTIKNTGGAARYYSKEDNYYLSEVDAKEASMWVGEGAVRLGLKGKVEEITLHELLNGKLPSGQIIGLQKDGTINHRAGYDLCFQAPKSVSILALDGGDRRIYDAHLSATKEALKIIERDCAQAKVYKGEKIGFENTKNLTIALVAHTTSRKLDLHLHHHALVMNFTQRQDNAWRALASSKIKGDQINGFFERIHKNQIYYGVIYKTTLANKVMQLGHEIEIVGPHGMWEIKGVPKEARELMSKRRREIEERIKELNLRKNRFSYSLKAADIITINTREKKPNNISLDTIRQGWKNELSAIGFSSKDYIAEIDRRKELNQELNTHYQNKDKDVGITEPNLIPTSTISHNAKEAVRNAIEHLSQYNLKLDYTKIASLALEFSVGNNSTHKDIVYALNDAIQTKSLIPLDKSDSLFVTKELIETEKTIMDLVNNSKRSSHPIKLKDKAISNIADGEIKEHALKVLQSKNRIHLIEHMAKDNTEFMSAVLKLAESSGKTVRVLSPNRMLANDINENIKRKPNNLWQWLVSLGKPEVGECIAGFIHEYKKQIDTPLLLGFRQGKELFIVNNAETLGTGDMKTLLELTEKTRARVIFLRDISIRQGFCAGNSMETLKQAGVEARVFNSDNSRLDKITNRIPELMVVPNDDERIKKLAKVFALKEDNERINTLVFVGSKARIKETNQAIRNELKNSGKLSNIEYKILVLNPIYFSKAEGSLAHKYQKDTIIRFYHNKRPHDDWVVESSDRNNNTLKLRFDGKDSFDSRSNNANTISSIDRISSTNNSNIINSNNSNIINSINIISSSNRLRQTWNPKHKEDKENKKNKADYKVFKREALSVSVGDKLIATAKMGFLGLGINNADRFTVTEINESHIRLSYFTSPENGNTTKTKSIKLSLKDPQNSHFDYDYATTLSKYSQKQVDHVIADFRAYALDKPTLNELNLRAKESLTVFTNDAKTVQNRFGFIPAKPTAVEMVLDASKVDRLINDKTIDEIKSDIELAISTLTNKNETAAKKAVDFAIEKITSRTAGFTHKELVTEALTYALQDQAAAFGKEVTHDDIMKAIIEKRNAGELVMGKYFEDGTRWTTKEILALEHSIIASLKGGIDKLEPLLDKDIPSKYLENTSLTQDQKNACYLITTTKDQFVIVQGYAGTGKTTMFAQIQSMLKDTNISIEMLALAPTHRAVKELKNVGIPAQTLKSFLVERHIGRPIEQPVEQQNVSAVATDLNNKLIILDEASMVSNKDFVRFLKVINGGKAHVAFSGDTAQHIAIESGKQFEMAQRLGILKIAYLKEIVRQRNPILKDAVESIIHGDYHSAFEKIANENPQSHIGRLEDTKETTRLR